MITFIQRVLAFFTTIATIISSFLGINGSLIDKKVDDFRVTTYIRGDAIMHWGGELYEEKSDGKLKRLFTRDGYLTGFILIGDTQRAGIYTSLIREEIPLSTINFDILKKNATSAAFSSEKREKMFGGVV